MISFDEHNPLADSEYLDDTKSRSIEKRLLALSNDEDVLQDEAWGDPHDQDVDRERDGEL